MNYLVRFHRARQTRGSVYPHKLRHGIKGAARAWWAVHGEPTQHLTWASMPRGSIIRRLNPEQMQASHVSMVRESPKQS